MTQIAPAALASTFLTSIVGAGTYGILALTTTGDIAPHWTLGLLCGAGGLIGGYLGARLQPYLPERALRLLLGTLATALAVLYLIQGLRLNKILVNAADRGPELTDTRPGPRRGTQSHRQRRPISSQLRFAMAYHDKAAHRLLLRDCLTV